MYRDTLTIIIIIPDKIIPLIQKVVLSKPYFQSKLYSKEIKFYPIEILLKKIFKIKKILMKINLANI